MIVKWPKQIGVGCVDITAKEKKYVMDVLNTGRLSYGPYHQKFEAAFAKEHQTKYAIVVNSGTSALRIAVAALKRIHTWNNGDEVLCPAVTFIATSNVVIMNNLKPIFVDVHPKTYNINPKEIEKHITKKTRAIMVVHLFGQPADMAPIMRIAKKYKLKVIEDSCETMFAKYKGKSVGSFGDISAFSTYAAHLITTGVGGIACTNNKEYAETMKSKANHGRDGIYLHIDADKNLDRQGLFNVVSRRFNFVNLGYSFRNTEMEAAIGCAQMERKNQIVGARRKNAAYLIKELASLSKWLQLPSWPKHADHSFMMFPIVVKQSAPFTKHDLVMFLEERNIETRDMMPLLNQPIYKELFGDIEKNYPVAKWINANGFYIGSHQQMTKAELKFIVSAFKEFLHEFN